MTDYSDQFRAANIQQLQQVCALICRHLPEALECAELGIGALFRKRLAAILQPDNRTGDRKYAEPRGELETEEKPLPQVPTCKPDAEPPTHSVTTLSPSEHIDIFLANLRGELMAGIADTDERMRAMAIVRQVEEARFPNRARGTFACPRCGKDTPHRHDEPQPDPTIIHAAEGVTLEPGEYLPWPTDTEFCGDVPFTVTESLRAEPCDWGSKWCFAQPGGGWVRSVRRVEANAQPDGERMPTDEEAAESVARLGIDVPKWAAEIREKVAAHQASRATLNDWHRVNAERQNEAFAPPHPLMALVACVQEEVGELAGAVLGVTGEKKRKAHKTREDVLDAVADAMTYLSLIAANQGCDDLEKLLGDVFNMVSERAGSNLRTGLGQPDCKGTGRAQLKDAEVCAEWFTAKDRRDYRCIMAKNHDGEHSDQTKDHLSTGRARVGGANPVELTEVSRLRLERDEARVENASLRERLEAAERESKYLRDVDAEGRRQKERAEKAEQEAKRQRDRAHVAETRERELGDLNSELTEKLATYEREAKAWEMIERWVAKSRFRMGKLTVLPRGCWWIELTLDGREVRGDVDDTSNDRLSAVEAAAAWCESQLKKESEASDG